MTLILSKSRRYRFTNSEFQKLELLKKYSIVESKFVRLAIQEKFERDFPKLKIKSEKIYCPF